MVNYKNSSIYKICCKDTNIKDIYVGSTTNFNRRKGEHKTKCCKEENKEYNKIVYKFIRENGGFNNWDMVEICKFSCDNKRELHKEERKYLELLDATLNKVIPTRTFKQYYEDNKDKILEKNKQYREDNKDEISKQKKEYSEKNKDKIKQYYKDNKEKILEKKKKKYNCECSGKYTNCSKSKHLKTKIHQDFIKKNKEN
jgi:hypothetical protein